MRPVEDLQDHAIMSCHILRLECCSNCRWWEKSPLAWAVVTLAILTSIVDRDGFLGLFESSAKSGCKKACWSSCGDWCASFDWLSQLNSLPVPHWCAQKHHIAKHWWFPKTVRSSRSRIFCMKFHEIPHRWPTESGFLQSRCGCTQRCCQTMSFEGAWDLVPCHKFLSGCEALCRVVLCGRR